MIIQLWKTQDTKKSFSFNGDTSGDVVVKKTINLDDNINLFIKKVFVYLHAHHKVPSENHLYFWIQDHIMPTKWLLVNFINNVFSTSSRIEKSTLITSINNYFSTSHKCNVSILLDKSDALKYMLSIKDTLKTRTEPLLFKYNKNGFTSFIQYDPTKQLLVPDQDTSSLSISTYEALTLKSLNLSDKAQFNFITSSFPTKHSKEVLFPFIEQSTESLETLDKFISSIDKVEKDIMNNDKAKEYKNQCEVTYLQMKMNETNLNPNVNLKTIFDNIQLNDVLPFAKYRAKINIFYKVFRPSLVGVQNVIDQWVDTLTSSSIIKNYTQTNLVYKIRYSDDAFVTLVFYEDLSYEVKFNLGVKNKDTIDNIFNFGQRIINVILRDIQTLYPNLYIPLLPVNFIESPEGRLIQYVTYNNISLEKKKIVYENLQGVVESRLFSYFSIINNPDKKLLHLQYKKVDNYTKYDNIQTFITNHFTSDKEVMIERIMKTFTLSQEAAEKEYEKWSSSNEVEFINDKGSLYVKPKNANNFINIKIKLNPSLLDLQYQTFGVKSVEMQEKISYLLNVLLELSKKKKIETIVDQAQYDDIVHNTVHKTDSNNLSFQELEELKTIDPIVSDVQGLVDDIDEDLLALEKEFMMEEQQLVPGSPTPGKDQDTQPNQPPQEKGKNQVSLDDKEQSKGYFLNKLYEADDKLFRYVPRPGAKNYSTTCQLTSKQQPVVLTEKEYKKIQREFPAALDGFVKAGYTSELKAKNYYVCPKIWCPISRVALSYDDYVKNKEKCPYPDVEENPIILDAPYWDWDNNKTRKRYPGFLKIDSHHPEKMCLPCCYKNDTSKGMHKARMDHCMPKEVPEEDKKPKNDIVGNEKYIKAADYFPLEKMRLGLLPKPLADLFGNKICGAYPNGTGLTNENTDCFVRRGVSQDTQSFLTAIIPLLDNKHIKEPSDIISIIRKSLTIEEYISLENGKLLRIFINKSANIFDKAEFIAFKEWFLEQHSYIHTFRLKTLQKELEHFNSFNKAEMPSYKEILREFIIYNSYKSYMNYMIDMEVQKDHRTLVDLIATDQDHINIFGYNIAIIEVDNDREKFYIQCPFNRSTKTLIDTTKPFIFLYKNDKYYEQIVHIKSTGKNFELTSKFSHTFSNNINNIIQFYYQNCSFKDNAMEDNIIQYFEKSTYLKIKHVVIDYSFRVKGIVLKNNLYIPFKTTVDIINIPVSYNYIYISDVVKIKCLLNKEEIKNVYDSLHKHTNDKYYSIKTYVIVDDKIVGITLEDNTFVPINVSSKNILYKLYGNDLDIFLNVESEDIRTSLMRTVEHDEGVFQELYFSSLESLNNNSDTKQELEFLMDPKNPFPMAFKRQKLLSLLKKVNSKSNNKFMEQVAEMMVKNRNLNFYVLKQKFKIHDNEVLLEYADILNNKLRDLINYEKNPFIALSERLDMLMESYVYDHEEFTRDTFDSIIASGELEKVPTKWKKILKDFQVLTHPSTSPYDTEYIYRFFSKLSSVINPKKVVMPEDLKAMVETNIVYDFDKNKLAELYENSSFREHKTMLKISTPTLQDVLSIFNSIYYYPSVYEITVLAKLLGVGVFITRRKQKGKDEEADVVGIIDVKKNKNRYILMKQSYDRVKKNEVFEVYVLNNNILLHRNDISDDFFKIIKKP